MASDDECPAILSGRLRQADHFFHARLGPAKYAFNKGVDRVSVGVNDSIVRCKMSCDSPAEVCYSPLLARERSTRRLIEPRGHTGRRRPVRIQPPAIPHMKPSLFPPALTMLAAALLPLASASPQARTAPVDTVAIPWAQPNFSGGPWHPRDTTPVPVVLSASGGISLGSYQAGVTYALVRAMRAANDDTGFREEFNLPRFRLSAVTGASAGNINALLSLSEWCSAEVSAPEQSAFWRAWVNVGWPQLHPDVATRSVDDYGTFDRAYFRDKLLADIAARLARTGARAECDSVPLAVTLTRMIPAPFAVTDELTAATQRHATVVQVHLTKGALGFRQPNPTLRRKSMGALVSAAVGTDATVSIDSLFNFVLASSAFPVAFAPVQLSYYPSSSLREDGGCPRDRLTDKCAPPDTAYFLDGGVFDNNPLSLALELHRERSPHRVVHFADGETEVARIVDQPARALFVGMDTRRGEYPGTSRATEEAMTGLGLGGLTEFGTHLIPSARQYEMQTLARTLDRDPSQPASYIRTTSRLMPVYGEHLGAFGAFLGRPLREHDFMAGLYDGLAFVAGDMVCAPASARRKAARTDSTGLACRADALGRMLDGRRLQLGAVAHASLCDIYRFEFSDELKRAPGRYCAPDAAAPANLTDVERDRITVLSVLHAGSARKLTTPVPDCRQKKTIAKTLCSSALGVQLESAWADTAFRRVITAWSDADCDEGALDEARTCRADESFVNLLKEPSETLLARAADVSFRVWQVEERIHKAHGKKSNGESRFEWAPMIELAEFAIRSSGQQTRRGFRGSPGSIPPMKFVHSWVHLLPYSAAPAVGVRGFELGWLPILHTRERWLAITFPLAYDHYVIRGLPEEVAGEDYARGGLGLMLKTGWNWMPDVSVNALGSVRLGSVPEPRSRMGSFEPEVAVGLLFGKLRASVSRMPSQSGGIVDGEPGKVVGTVGLSDVSGMLYWLFR